MEYIVIGLIVAVAAYFIYRVTNKDKDDQVVRRSSGGGSGQKDPQNFNRH